MTVLDVWVPDHVPVSGIDALPAHARAQVEDTATEQMGAELPRRPSVDDQAWSLLLWVVEQLGGFDDVDDVTGYQDCAYWRDVFKRASQHVMVRAGSHLERMQESGVSSRKIADRLARAGSPLSASAVDQAIARARAAQAESEQVMEP